MEETRKQGIGNKKSYFKKRNQRRFLANLIDGTVELLLLTVPVAIITLFLIFIYTY